MSDLIRIAKGLSPVPQTILVLGARSEAMLNWLFTLTSSQIVMIEPEKILFDKAKVIHDAKGNPSNLTIKYGAPSIKSSQKKTAYFQSGVPGFSSQFIPNDIKTVRPSLNFTECELPLVAVEPIIQQLDIDENKPCLLIIQLNGGETELLNNELFHVFTHSIIQSSLKPLFGKDVPSEKVKRYFTEDTHNYIFLPETIPPYVNVVRSKPVNAETAFDYYYQREKHHAKVNELQTQLKDAKEQLSALVEDARQTKKLEELIDELEQEKKEFQNAKEQSERSHLLLKAELDQAKSQLGTAEKARDEYENELTKYRIKVEARITELEKLLKNRDEQLVQQSQQTEKIIKEKEEKIGKISAEIEDARASEHRHINSLNVTSKLNLKLQSDLEELRKQFSEKVREEKELTELINELYKKLKQASEFYFELEKKHPELMEE